MTVTFELDGQEFMALNGGPQFKFTEAISFMVNCETQEEIDEMWEKLSARRRKGECAAGSKTNMGCRGRSFLLLWTRCCKTRMLRKRKES